jgi:hypothetical protein
MKSIKILGLIITAIALFPAASFADNINYSNQETNLNSQVFGHGNVEVTDTYQSIYQRQKSGYRGINTSTSYQKINSVTTTVGDDNINLKKSIQRSLDRQYQR